MTSSNTPSSMAKASRAVPNTASSTARQLRSLYAVAIAAASLPLVASACGARIEHGLHGTDTGNPPVVDSARIAARLDGETIVVRGQEGAVPAGADVQVENATSGVTVRQTANGDGSFEVSLPGVDGDAVVVEVSANGETAQVTLQAVQGASPVASSAPASEAGENPASSSGETPDAGPFDPSAPKPVEPRDVGWSNVDWLRSLAIDLSEGVHSSGGLWMGTGIGDGEGFATEPVADPPYVADGEATVLRLSGQGRPNGTDTYFHMAIPIESVFDAAYFYARRSGGEHATLLVTLGGPYDDYWREVASGRDWPVWELQLRDEWTKYELEFSDLGFDADHLSPFSGPFGALHFLVEPDRGYDFEVYDPVLLSFLRE